MKLITVEVTPGEWQLIEVIRDLKVDFGRIPMTIYIQHGKLIRVELEIVVKSKIITN